MNKSRFKQLLESSVGNVKPLTENKFSTQDITFERGDNFCKLKIGYQEDTEGRHYNPLLICNDNFLGEDSIRFVFSELKSRTFQRANDLVCKYLEPLSEKIQDIMDKGDGRLSDVVESTQRFGRYEVFDDPIICDSNLFDN